MPKWIVEVRLIKDVTVEVEAPGYFQARSAAEAQADMEGFIAHGTVKRQLGEPWCRSLGWYMDRPDTPSQIIYVERAHGNAFTTAQVALLRERVTAFGLTIVDEWNGVGCSGVSFRCHGRVAAEPLSPEQLAALTAPLPSALQSELT